MTNDEAWRRDLENAVRGIQSELEKLTQGLAQDLSRILATLERIEKAVHKR